MEERFEAHVDRFIEKSKSPETNREFLIHWMHSRSNRRALAPPKINSHLQAGHRFYLDFVDDVSKAYRREGLSQFSRCADSIVESHFIQGVRIGQPLESWKRSFKFHNRTALMLLKRQRLAHHRSPPQSLHTSFTPSRHPESPLALTIIYHDSPMGQVGFSVTKENRKGTIRINNLQGMDVESVEEPLPLSKPDALDLEGFNELDPIERMHLLMERAILNFSGPKDKRPVDRSKHVETYAKLNETLGENWRVHLVKRLLEVAREHRLQVVGEMPLLDTFVEADDRKKAHARALRQYAQTYKAAGLVKQPDGTFRLPSS